MKPRLTKTLSLALAGILQVAPVVRTLMPAMAAPTGALILRWVVGGFALMGYHAISSATSLSTPPVATLNSPYSATIAYNGGHSGSVESMSMSNICLGSSTTLCPGLTIKYIGGYTAEITGTPTTLENVPITLDIFNSGDCSGYTHSGYVSTTLAIQNSAGGAVAPSMAAAPQNILSQVGVNVVLSGAATGNPTPQYYWKQGTNFISGATNNSLALSSAQLTNAGIYTLIASNSAGQAFAACYVTMALTPSSLLYNFTNYVVAGTPVSMTSYITNASSAVNTYSWLYNGNPIGVTTSNLNLSGAQTIPLRSGTYSIQFNSTVGGTSVVSNQYYDSYWQFGFLPVVTNQPSPVSVGIGSNATFTATIAGSSYPTLLWYQNATNLVHVETDLTNAYNPTTIGVTTNITFTLTNVTSANAGNYTVVVTNFWGSTTSSVAALTVTGGAPAVSSPVGVTNYAGKNVNFTVTGSGTGPLGYQWQKNSANLSNGGTISGATTNTLSIAPAAVTDSGSYRVIVTNSSGSVTSTVAPLSILALPQFGISLVSNATLSATGGVPGSNYIVQFTTNLLSSNSWVNLKTNVVPVGGVINFTDTNLATLPQGYYRVQFP